VSEGQGSGIRLNKHIADSGYCARRKADALIAAGRVQVNGETVTEMGSRVDPAKDTVTVDGKLLPAAMKHYLAFHKPVGTVTSRRAGRQQKSIYALLPEEYQAVDPAGRLDQDSSGLLILSSDGDFLNRITHPRYHLPKLYEITLDQPLKPADLQKLKEGILLMPENKLARMAEIQPEKTIRAFTYRVTLFTGYNRQIRRSMAELGYRVHVLKRLAFGSISLGNLSPGSIRALHPAEINQLLALSPSPKPEERQHRAQKKDR
jgi:23S rRNA pseudouridine2605 synthase